MAESVHLSFVRGLRKAGVPAWSDGEVFQAFDMEYDYDIREKMDAYLRGEDSLASYIELLDRQEGSYPANYVKLRNLENHDNPRIAHWVKDPLARTNWTAFLYFQNGATLLYAGQEASASHQPSLFDLDPVDWEGGPDIRPLLIHLRKLQKKLVPADGIFTTTCLEDRRVQVTIETAKQVVQAFFHLEGKGGEIQLETKETSLLDWFSNQTISLDQGKFTSSGQPLIFVLGKE